MTIDGHQVSLSEHPSGEATATISGSQSAWIAALGPDADRSGLEVTGDAHMGDAMLDSVGAQARRAINAA
jgi:hypothetical protein